MIFEHAGVVIAGLDPQVGFTRLAADNTGNSGKPELRCNPSIFAKTSHEEDGCAGQARA